MIKILLVDGSPRWIRAIRDLIDADSEMTLVGVVQTAREAMQLCEQHHPDLVVMDVDTPLVNAGSAAEAIAHACPVPILLSTAMPAGGRAFDLLRGGAVDVVHKGVLLSTAAGAGEALSRRLKVLASIPVARPRRCIIPSREQQRSDALGAASPAPTPQSRGAAAAEPAGRRSADPGEQQASEALPPLPRSPVRAVGIVASTGGPDALHRLLAPLPAELPFGILVVQHLAAGFLASFVGWLGAACRLRVSVADSGQRLLAGQVLIGPDGCHLTLSKAGRVHLAPGQPSELHCPSGDRLLHSLADGLGGASLGIVMSGIGKDGADGLMALRRAGGMTLAQDRASCVIYGMPAACAESEAAQIVLPPELMAHYLQRVAKAAATAQRTDEGGSDGRG